jgi:imidazole glycerol-phosphate synthase subunit HisH
MIAIIDYGAGNVASVANAIEKLGKEFVITNNEYTIYKAEKIIFPGVGEASFAIRQLHLLNLFSFIRMIKKPMLGICLGMQLMCEFSDEGNTSCLGIFPGRNVMFDSKLCTVPHMGWNEVKQIKQSKLFDGIKDNEFFYFAHSYYLPVNEFTTSTANHSVDVTASIEKDNFYGVQFHPEKSGEAGLHFFNNFINL